MFVQMQAFGKVERDPELVVTKGAMLFVQGHFTPHQYMTEDGKQGVSLEVNVEKFSFAEMPRQGCSLLPQEGEHSLL